MHVDVASRTVQITLCDTHEQRWLERLAGGEHHSDATRVGVCRQVERTLRWMGR